MFHTVYLITNLVNNKIYVGKHSTWNLNKTYMGKGTAIRSAIKKYGVENFKKDILYFCLSEEDAFEIESNIVDESFISRPDTYNIVLGGGSCSDWLTHHPNKEEILKKISIGVKAGQASMTKEAKQKMFDNRKQTLSNPDIILLHRINTKQGMKNMSTTDTLKMKENMKGNNNNKRKWLLSNTLGQTYIIEDLKTFCKENNYNYGYMFYTLRRLKKAKFWKLEQLTKDY